MTKMIDTGVQTLVNEGEDLRKQVETLTAELDEQLVLRGKAQEAEKVATMEAKKLAIDLEASQGKLGRQATEIAALRRERDEAIAREQAAKQAKMGETETVAGQIFEAICRLEKGHDLMLQARHGAMHGQDTGREERDHYALSAARYAIRNVGLIGQGLIRDRSIWSGAQRRRVTIKGTFNQLQAAEVAWELAKKDVEAGADGAESRLRDAMMERQMWRVLHEQIAKPLASFCEGFYEQASGEPAEAMIERVYGAPTKAQAVSNEAVQKTAEAEFEKLMAG